MMGDPVCVQSLVDLDVDPDAFEIIGDNLFMPAEDDDGMPVDTASNPMSASECGECAPAGGSISTEVDMALLEGRAAEHALMIRRMEALRAQLRAIGMEPCV